MAKKIMVVDDSRVMELQMQHMLEGSEYEITAYCRDGEEAIARFDEVNPDIVTMDILMPGMDGLETAQAILAERPEANVIMLSSLAYDDTLDEAKRIGAKGFLFKPFDRETLIETLGKALGTGSL